jgi:hypothetical protein
MVERAAEQVATTIDRRRFLRRAAQGTFYTLAVITAGGGLAGRRPLLPPP